MNLETKIVIFLQLDSMIKINSKWRFNVVL